MLDMAPRKQKPGRKPSKRKPKRSGRNVNVWLSPELGQALEKALETIRPRPDITGLTEAAFEEFFQKRGLWPLGNQPPGQGPTSQG